MILFLDKISDTFVKLLLYLGIGVLKLLISANNLLPKPVQPHVKVSVHLQILFIFLADGGIGICELAVHGLPYIMKSKISLMDATTEILYEVLKLVTLGLDVYELQVGCAGEAFQFVLYLGGVLGILCA